LGRVGKLETTQFAHLIAPNRGFARSAFQAEDPLETTMIVDGECHCGRIAFSAEVDPSRLTLATAPTAKR
jgi:hypothetical protein